MFEHDTPLIHKEKPYREPFVIRWWYDKPCPDSNQHMLSYIFYSHGKWREDTFYFTAERRVDFRELVRDLAAIFRTRIELRQIGVRDEARLKGGIGICGREFCCSTFLHQFVPVTLKMAKEQQLPMNPGKLSGPCGRLRCCLTYEYADYREVLKRLPRVGTRVRRDGEEGQVRKLDLVQETITVYFDEVGDSIVCTPDQLTWQRGQEH